MKLKSKWMLIPLLGLALGTAWAFTSDQGEPAGPPEKPGWSDQAGAKDELGLTEEQKTKLRALHMEARKAGIRTRSDLQVKQLELQELLEADNPDKVAIDKKVRELSDARHLQMKQRIDQRLAFHSLLTPEQRLKAKELRQRLHRRMMARRFMRQRGMGGAGMPGMRGQRGRGFGPGSGQGPGFGQGRRFGQGPAIDQEGDWDEDFDAEPPLPPDDEDIEQ